MKNDDRTALNWIESQQNVMEALVEKWATINTYSFNLLGLKFLSQKLSKSFSVFKEPVQFIPLNSKEELAPVLSIQKRPHALKQVLLVNHFDTVYPLNTPISELKKKGNVLKGPGVTDSKGGIAVMLKALEAFEQTPWAKDVGWRVVLTTDEEIGSPGSSKIWPKIISKFDLGLVFEPCLPNGNLVGARSGSANFTLEAHGRSAHAGRNLKDGRNAIEALAECIYKIESFIKREKNVTINFGYWEGGGPVNVVPDKATARFNVRMNSVDDYVSTKNKIQNLINDIQRKRKVRLALTSILTALPKPLTPKTLKLLQAFKQCGRELGLDLSWEKSSGVCDGNRLQALGLPTIDTLGAQGGRLHSPDEFLLLRSLSERVKLTTLFLSKWARGEWKFL